MDTVNATYGMGAANNQTNRNNRPNNLQGSDSGGQKTRAENMSTDSLSTTTTNNSRNPSSTPMVLRHLSFEADILQEDQDEASRDRAEDFAERRDSFTEQHMIEYTSPDDLDIAEDEPPAPTISFASAPPQPSAVGSGLLPSFLPPQRQARAKRLQGVLWKRRDVFTAQWRPRWFVLHPRQGILTYYLLTNPLSAASGASTPTSARSSSMPNEMDFSPLPPPSSSFASNRRRTLSESSNFSENTVDYDVVPRGTIVLRPAAGACRVRVNKVLTRPSEDLYAFTITTPSPGSKSIHLAARTTESRDNWMNTIELVCKRGTAVGNNNNNAGVTASSTSNDGIAGVNTESTSQALNSSTTAAAAAAAPAVPAAASLPSSQPGDRIELKPRANLMLPTIASTPPREAAQSQDPPAQQQDHDAGTAGGQANALRQRPTASVNTYKSQSTQDVMHGVPGKLVTKIEDLLTTFLPMCTIHDDSATEWTTLFESDGVEHGVSAYTRDMPGRPGMQLLKSQAFLPHSARQLAMLLLNPTKRRTLEPNIRYTERSHVYNANTVLDYYAYHAVWPTSARDFAVALHWQVLSKSQSALRSANDSNEDSAIVIVACSYPDEYDKAPSPPNHVRGDLLISLYLLEPGPQDPQDEGPTCQLTRLLCYDLCGSIPKRLIKTILVQQAYMPNNLNLFLYSTPDATELDNPFDRVTPQQLRKDVKRHILQEYNELLVTPPKRRKRISFASDAPQMPDAADRGDADVDVDASLQNSQQPTRRSSSSSTEQAANSAAAVGMNGDAAPSTTATISSRDISLPSSQAEEGTSSSSLMIIMALVLTSLLAYCAIQLDVFTSVGVGALPQEVYLLAAVIISSIITLGVTQITSNEIVAVLALPFFMYYIGRTAMRAVTVTWPPVNTFLVPPYDLLFVMTALLAIRRIYKLTLGAEVRSSSQTPSGHPQIESCTFTLSTTTRNGNMEDAVVDDIEVIEPMNVEATHRINVIGSFIAQIIGEKEEYRALLAQHVQSSWFGVDGYFIPNDIYAGIMTSSTGTSTVPLSFLEANVLSCESMDAAAVTPSIMLVQLHPSATSKLSDLRFGEAVPLTVVAKGDGSIEIRIQQPTMALQLCEKFVEDLQKAIDSGRRE